MWPTPVTCCTPGDMPQQKRWPKSALDFSGPVFLICERKTKQTLHASTLRKFVEVPVRKALGAQGCCCLGGWLRLTRVAVLWPRPRGEYKEEVALCCTEQGKRPSGQRLTSSFPGEETEGF